MGIAGKLRPRIECDRELGSSELLVDCRTAQHFTRVLNTPMRLHHSLLFLIAISGSAFGQNVRPITERVATQNALFEEQYQSDLRSFPERATAFGDLRYNDKLGEYSLAALSERHKTDQDFLARLKAIPTSGFSEQDQLSHDLLIRVLGQRLADYDLKEHEMPINQFNGIHLGLADLPLSVP